MPPPAASVSEMVTYWKMKIRLFAMPTVDFKFYLRRGIIIINIHFFSLGGKGFSVFFIFFEKFTLNLAF